MLNTNFVNEQNPWWIDYHTIEKDEKVKAAMANKPGKQYDFPTGDNLIILGPRQVGKTTYMKLAVLELLEKNRVDPKNVLFFSCDALSDKQDILELVQYFDSISDKASRRYLFLDEITFVKDWNVALLALFNSDYLKDKTIWVTGSSSMSLQKETLPGRNIKKRYFYPLSFREYVDLFYGKIKNAKTIDLNNIEEAYKASTNLMPHLSEINRLFESYSFVTGGLLSTSYLFFNAKKDPFNVYGEIYRDALLSDLFKTGLSETTFKETLYGIFESYGSCYSSNSIAKRTSIGSHKTVEAYIEAMGKLFILNTVYKIQDKRVMYRSNKKSYFVDPFIYRVMHLYSAGANAISESDKPKIAEGVVGSMLSRRYQDQLNYLRTKQDKEVDFVVNGVGIEVKYGNGKTSDLNTEKGYVLTKSGAPVLDGKRASMPISIFLYLLS